MKLTRGLIPGQIMNISSNFRSKDALNPLHTLLNANNVESCKKLIDDLSWLWAIQADNVDFSKLAKDDFGTSLIPDIDCKQASHPVSVAFFSSQKYKKMGTLKQF